MRKTELLFMAISVIIPWIVSAQAPAIEWQNTIGGNKTDILYCVRQTSNGKYIVAGSSNSGPTSDKSEKNQAFDYWISRLDQSGNVIWETTLGGSSLDYCLSVQPTSDGGFITGGSSKSGISGEKSEACKGNYDYWVVKLDQDGAVQWNNTLGGTKADYLNCVFQTLDGGYFLAGHSESNISSDKSQSSRGGYDYWVVKLDANGNVVWDKTYGGSVGEYLYSAVQTGAGDYVLNGYSGSKASGDKSENSKGGIDYWVVKLDGNGNKLWDKTIGGSGSDFAYSIGKISGGGFILGGYSDSGISGDKTEDSRGTYDFWVVRIDMNGNILWDKTAGGEDEDELYAVKQTYDGGFILGGYSESEISGEKSEACRGYYDYWLVKLDLNGSLVWDKTLGGDSEDELYSLDLTNDGGYIVGGYSDSNISGDKTENSLGTADYWLVKLEPDGLMRTEVDALPVKVKKDNPDVTCYPNPSSGTFTISVSQPIRENVVVILANAEGREVYRKEFDADLFQSPRTISPDTKLGDGVYLLRVFSGEMSYTNRIVILH